MTETESGLGKDSLYKFEWFNFRFKTENQDVINTADALLKELGGFTGKKDSIKKDFMVKLLLNLKESQKTNKYIGIMRTPRYYAAIPDKYREETQSYETVKRITDLLIDNNYILFKKGGKNAEKYTHGVPSKIRPLEKIFPILNDITADDLIIELPRESIILRDAKGYDSNGNEVKGKDINYDDTPQITQWRADLSIYNEFLNKNSVTLEGLPKENDEDFDYLQNYDAADTLIIDDSKFGRKDLKNIWVKRIFNVDFNHGGRFYGGVENLRSDLRPFIHINGSRTVELDFSSYQIRMLYHKLKIKYLEDAYAAMCESDSPDERAIYKFVTLIVLNAEDEKIALKSLRKKLVDENLMCNVIKTDPVLKKLINKFTSHHDRVSKYFYKGVGLKLHVLESEITNNILLHFVKKNILVLSVHDSFIIAAEHESELLRRMKIEYKRIFRYDPVIK